jgi:hypothetical protein
MYQISQWAYMYASFLGSMVASASVVHYVLRPNLALARAPFSVAKRELS